MNNTQTFNNFINKKRAEIINQLEYWKVLDNFTQRNNCLRQLKILAEIKAENTVKL